MLACYRPYRRYEGDSNFADEGFVCQTSVSHCAAGGRLGWIVDDYR